MKMLAALFFAFLLFVFVTPTYVSAKRLLPKAKPGTTVKTGRVSGTKGVSTSVKFRGDRRAIVVTFTNPEIATKVDYVLSYATRRTTQGASGSLSSASGSVSRELLFGTCSHGVCRYDSGITNARFVVTTTLPNGRRVVKSFRLKV